ncbi:PREDICTED: receptor protein kinase-like protein ZAR1 [Camelina sativa]|uniref:Receptor protein kinase-like protein ZAR1 n=1 Tax=Camelina sativa TaxID=90675 RepID=A0ABM0SS17_CAMSA|nr:PREDICTED: receptor protein kinase-like protein ZAR1 [Camelina sativa]
MILLSLLLHLLLNTSPSHSLSPDGVALLSLKSAVDQSSSSSFSDWNENDSDPCHWSGISCMNISDTSVSRVVGISLAGKNLRGYIPSELGSLVYLRRLNLHNNELHGSIPTQLFNATSLHSLFLYGNNLTGALPPSICKLPKLQNLDLSSNSLSGTLSPDLNKCKQLQRLILAANKFSGEVPGEIWPELKNLAQLDLSANEFTGEIPKDLGKLKSLSGTLNLSFNHLTGEIPKSLGNLPVTVSLDLRNNDLSGEIPQSGSFSNQGPTAFLNNPKLCGFPLQKSCKDSDQNSPGTRKTPVNKSDSRRGLSTGLIVLISVADAGSVALIGLVIVYLYWKKKDSEGGCSCTGNEKLGGSEKGKSCCCLAGFPKELDDSEAEENERGGGGGEWKGDGELVAIDKGFSFELDELLRASAYVLGKSGLGIVYKVVLGNGVPVAVRRLGEGGEQRYKEFVAEVQAMGKVKHPNVVKLRAYYWAPDEKLLISDFVNNGSLADALRGRNGQPSPSLTWSTRLKIAKGAARGLAYLHECSPRKLVHGDVKTSNILLDSSFTPYISDFGLTRLITITAPSASSNEPSSSSAGGFLGGALPYTSIKPSDRSNGYKAPEARLPGGRPTQKWDVYSFGVVLMELLTGKSPDSSPPSSSSSTLVVEVPDLVKWVRKGFEEETPLSDMVDPMLLQEVYAKQQVLSVFHLALSCTEGDPEVRPRMKNVSENIDKI